MMMTLLTGYAMFNASMIDSGFTFAPHCILEYSLVVVISRAEGENDSSDFLEAISG